MGKYVEDVVLKNLDETVTKIVTNRIGKLVSANRWSTDRKINGKTLEEYVRKVTEKVISDIIDNNIKDIFARKVAEML